MKTLFFIFALILPFAGQAKKVSSKNAPAPKQYSQMDDKEALAASIDLKTLKKSLSEQCKKNLSLKDKDQVAIFPRFKAQMLGMTKAFMATGMLAEDLGNTYGKTMSGRSSMSELCTEVEKMSNDFKTPEPCQSRNKKDIKQCFPAPKSVAENEECTPKKDVCEKGLCQKVNYGQLSMASCKREKQQCQQGKDCCSGQCDSGQCREVYRCLNCASEGQNPKREGKDRCCPGLFINPNGQCSSSLVRSLLQTLLLDSASADESIEGTALTKELQEKIDAQKKAQEEKSKAAKETAKAKLDADASRYSLGEDDEDDAAQVNNRTNALLNLQNDSTAAKIKEQYDGQNAKPTFSSFNKSDVKKCQFHWQDDLHSMMTETERRSEAILESFEMMSINDVVEDYWKDSSGKNLHARMKDVATKFKNARKDRALALQKNSKDMRCMCIGLKGPNHSDLVKADYDFFDSQCKTSTDETLKKFLEGIAKIKDQKDTGADGVQYKQLFYQYVSNQNELYKNMMDMNVDISTELINLFDSVAETNWGESNDSSSVSSECVSSFGFNVAASSINATLSGNWEDIPGGLLETVPGVQIYNLLSYDVPDDGYDYSQIKVSGDGITGGLKAMHSAWPGPSTWEGDFCTYCTTGDYLVDSDCGVGNDKLTRTITVSPNQTCGVSAPANFCVKTVLNVTDSSLVFPTVFGDLGSNANQYLIDPFLPDALKGSDFDKSVTKSGDSLSFTAPVVGDPFYQKFKNYVTSYIDKEALLFDSTQDKENYAKYVWQYHFILPALKYYPTYPSLGLLNYLSFLVEHSLIVAEMRGKNIVHTGTLLNNIGLDIQNTDLSMDNAISPKEGSPPPNNPIDVKQDQDLLNVFSQVVAGGDPGALSSYAANLQKGSASLKGKKTSGRLLASTMAKYAAAKRRYLDRQKSIKDIVNNAGSEKAFYEKQLASQAALKKGFSQPFGSSSASTGGMALGSNNSKGNEEQKVNEEKSNQTGAISSDDDDGSGHGSGGIGIYGLGGKVHYSSQSSQSSGKDKGKQGHGGEELHSVDGKKMPLREGASLWEIVTRRYMISGVPRLLEEEKK